MSSSARWRNTFETSTSLILKQHKRRRFETIPSILGFCSVSLWLRGAKVLPLSRPRDFGRRDIEKFHELAEGRKIDALVVSVDSSLIFSPHVPAPSLLLHTPPPHFPATPNPPLP